MSKKFFTVILVGSLALMLSFTVGNAAPKYPPNMFEFIAPAGAGGGWDITIRTVAKTLMETKLVKAPMPVTNMVGGGGGVALSYLQQKKGKDSIITVYSPPLLLINLNGSTPLGYKDTTPLARLIADYEVFAVGKDSKYKSLNDIMEALKKDPKSVKIGGTSAAGSLDHLAFLYIAKTAGVKNLKAIDYIAFMDNSAAAQVMGGHVDMLVGGFADVRGLVESGDLRALAVTAERRIGTGLAASIPTCKEQGINATFTNWRGLFGTPGMPSYAVSYWRKTLKKMVATKQWANACKQYGWGMTYLDKPEFEKFLVQTNEDYKALLQEIGMLK
jgi:putative tricarboxylic transport membrane protein